MSGNESRVFSKVAMSLVEAKLVKLNFEHLEVVAPGTPHRQNIAVNQAVSIIDGPAGSLLGLGKAKLVIESQVFEPERPHFRIECEYGGVFKILESEPGLHAGATVSDAVVDAVCGYILPLATSEIGRTLWQSGLKLNPKIWSMEASRDLAAAAQTKDAETAKKKRTAARTKA